MLFIFMLIIFTSLIPADIKLPMLRLYTGDLIFPICFRSMTDSLRVGMKIKVAAKIDAADRDYYTNVIKPLLMIRVLIFWRD